MTHIFADGALHPGRDANDAAWIVVRAPHEWAGAELHDVVHDAAAPGLVLAPRPVDGDAHRDAALAGVIVGPDGAEYRADPASDVVWIRGACDAAGDRRVLVGGRGEETGRLRRPLGLALEARRGLLAIADADNHRVQVVRADDGSPVAVLGCLDAWGRGVAPAADGTPAHALPGDGGAGASVRTGGRSGCPDGALAEPVRVAFGGGRLAVADRAGARVHVYDDRFRHVAAFAPVPRGAPTGFRPAPIAVAIAGCVVWVLDAGWSVIAAYGLGGAPIADPGAPPAELFPAGVARFAARGVVVHGPFDGQREGLAWHRVIVDALVPAGTGIEVQTFASDEPIAPAVIPWAPGRPIRIPLAEVDRRDGESDRIVLSDHGRWTRRRGEPYLRVSAPIARLAGTGPASSTTFTVPWAAARRLRIADDVQLRAGTATTPVLPIADLHGRDLRVVVRGDELTTYGVGATLELLERDGAAPIGGPRLLRELVGSDAVDLSTAHADGTLYDAPSAHAIAALVRDGDVLRLRGGGQETILEVHSVDAAAATVELAAAVAGDFSTSDLRLVTAADRLVVDPLAWEDGVPAGEPILVHADLDGTPPVVAAMRWVEPELGQVWLEPGPPVPLATWTRFTLADPVATDRGRYLWLRLALLGAVPEPGATAATASPVVRSVRLLLPRPSLLRYLPAVYARRDDDDPSGALFLERLLALPERRLTAIEAAYESVARELDPMASSAEWLEFIATWFGLAFDPSWPVARRRALVENAHDLFARRGTVDGMRRYLEIYTGFAPAIVEGFQHRVNAAPTTLVGGGVVLGRAALGEPVATAGRGGTGLAHTFSIWVFGDGAACGAEVTARAARAIIDSTKPAHTSYELQVIVGAPRVGISTMVGVDTVLVGGDAAPPPLGLLPQPSPVLGRLHLPAPPHARAAPTLGPIPLDGDFTLT
jgi:phage tail-like protein